MNICIDIDGTITEAYYWLDKANMYFNTNVKEEDVISYSFDDVLGMPKGSYLEFYGKYGETIHAEAEIRTGVKEILNVLSNNNHKIHYVTARKANMQDVTEKWIKQHELPTDSLILLGSPDKVLTAKQLSADIFIEDSLDNVLMLADAGIPCLLLDCHYNSGKLPENVTRVNNWHEIYKIIKALSVQRKPQSA